MPPLSCTSYTNCHSQFDDFQRSVDWIAWAAHLETVGLGSWSTTVKWPKMAACSGDWNKFHFSKQDQEEHADFMENVPAVPNLSQEFVPKQRVRKHSRQRFRCTIADPRDDIFERSR